MTTITIPKSQSKKSDLVAITREEYQEFLSLRKIVPFFSPTKAELKALARAEKDIKQGKYKSWSIVKNELANLRHKPRGKTA